MEGKQGALRHLVPTGTIRLEERPFEGSSMAAKLSRPVPLNSPAPHGLQLIATLETSHKERRQVHSPSMPMLCRCPGKDGPLVHPGEPGLFLQRHLEIRRDRELTDHNSQLTVRFSM